MSKKSNEQFLEELSIKNPNITPLEEYNGHHTKMLFIDNLGIKYRLTPAAVFLSSNPIIFSAVDKNAAFEIKAKLVHGSHYDYSNVKYISNNKKVDIICNHHGIFHQIPSAHLSGKGCKQCSMEKLFKIVQSDTNSFIEKANIIHNNKYDYSISEYTKARNKIKIICLEHGSFEQTVSDHLSGCGCLKCAIENGGFGFKKSEFIKIANEKNMSIVYIIKCFNDTEKFVKIGITTCDISERFSSKYKLPYQHQVIDKIENNPYFVWDKEKELHKKFKNQKYKPLIPFGGDTECFNIEILKLL